MSAMAANSSEEEKPFSPGIVDGSCKIPINCSCVQLLKPSLDEVNQHCSLDVLPILFEETSFPVTLDSPLHNSLGQDFYSISVLSDEGNDNPKSASQLAFLSFVEVPNPSTNVVGLDAQMNCQNCITLQKENANAYSPCIVDMDIEKENLETLAFNDETGSLKSQGVLTPMQKMLCKQNSLKMGGKFMQILMNHVLMSLKFTSRDKSVTEKAHDAPNNRWRRYKRSASFDSRKVVLSFSTMSIFGTLVLIYLTLRVRQSSDGFVHV